MNNHSNLTKTLSVIISVVISYILVIIRFTFLAPLLININMHFISWALLEFGTAVLCVVLPVLIARHKFHFEYFIFLLSIPIIFLSVLLYSPEGLYIFILKVTSQRDISYGMKISIEFFTLQIFALILIEGISDIYANSKKRRWKANSENENTVK